MVFHGGCRHTAEWESRWNYVNKFLERSRPFIHPDFEPSIEAQFTRSVKPSAGMKSL
uniref:Uncharacterized protein n=1 Tax=Sphaeramia orbicularis TaxID=375764 RepID=A0A673B142_9TELE